MNDCMEIITMNGMAKRGRKPKHGQQDSHGRSGRSLSLRLNPAIAAWLDAFIEAQELKPSYTTVVEKALENFFMSKNFPSPH